MGTVSLSPLPLALTSVVPPYSDKLTEPPDSVACGVLGPSSEPLRAVLIHTFIEVETMAKYKIAWLPGDGVGVDVMDATRIVLDALKFDAEYIHGDIGWEFWCKEGDAFPQRTIDLLKFVDAAWKQAQFGVSHVRADLLSTNQSQYGNCSSRAAKCRLTSGISHSSRGSCSHPANTTPSRPTILNGGTPCIGHRRRQVANVQPLCLPLDL